MLLSQYSTQCDVQHSNNLLLLPILLCTDRYALANHIRLTFISICSMQHKSMFTICLSSKRFYSTRVRVKTLKMLHCNYGKFSLHLVEPEMEKSSGKTWNTSYFIACVCDMLESMCRDSLMNTVQK